MNNKKHKKNKNLLKLCFIGDARSIHTQHWVNEFVDKSHEVYLLDTYKYAYKKLNFIQIKNYTKIPFLDFFFRILQIRQKVRKIKPDILHSHQVSYHGLMGAFVNLHPFILSPWGSDITHDPEKSFFHKLIAKYIFRKADYIQCMEPSLAERVEEIYRNARNKCFILNEGVKTSIYKKRTSLLKKSKKIRLTYLRKIMPNYNTSVFIEALNLVINKYNYHNLIVNMIFDGENNYKKKIFNLINEYGLKKKIKFYNWSSQEKMMEFLNNSEIFIDTCYKEKKGGGIGKTNLEAMSSELVVLMPDNPGRDTYLRDRVDCILYKGLDSKSLAKCILLLIKNSKLRKKIGKNARKAVLKKADWEKNMVIMEKKYYSFVKSNKDVSELKR